MQYIYILKLGDGCYYVGKTSNVDARLDQHVKGKASTWTRLHKVGSLLDSFEEVHPIDELKTTLDLMAKHGIAKVRGDIYSQLTLSFDQHLNILRHLRSMTNACLACGENGHFIQDCVAHMCYRCGRAGHTVEECYAKSHGCGGRLDGCYRCGRPDHWRFRCNRSRDAFGRLLPASYIEKCKSLFRVKT